MAMGFRNQYIVLDQQTDPLASTTKSSTYNNTNKPCFAEIL